MRNFRHILFFSAILIPIYCFAKNKDLYFIFDDCKIKIPGECIITDDAKKTITCIKNNTITSVGIKRTLNIENLLESQYVYKIKYLKNSIFVKLKIGNHYLDHLYLIKDKILIYGDDENFILEIGADICKA